MEVTLNTYRLPDMDDISRFNPYLLVLKYMAEMIVNYGMTVDVMLTKVFGENEFLIVKSENIENINKALLYGFNHLMDEDINSIRIDCSQDDEYSIALYKDNRHKDLLDAFTFETNDMQAFFRSWIDRLPI